VHRHVLLPEQAHEYVAPYHARACRGPLFALSRIKKKKGASQADIRLVVVVIDLGTGNNNKLNFVLEDKQELIDIVETIYKGAKKGRGLVVSPKDYSTRYRY